MDEYKLTEGNLPSGEVTFLFTDIEGSTKLAQDSPDTLNESIQKHNTILREAIESNGGFVFRIVGDAFNAAFANSENAVGAAKKSQAGLLTEKWPNAEIKVRMGIHRGPVEWNGSEYMGYITLARTNRVMSAACGGQVLLTDNVHSAIEKSLPNISFKDMGERRLKDLIQPVRLFQMMSPDLPSDFPPIKSLDIRPNNFPVQLTSFIGRDKEIASVKEKVRNSRLLTITGTGGSGKTRLALQAVADLIDEYDNGVWIADLAPLSDANLIPQVILQALAVKEELQSSAEDTLLRHLQDKQAILILDNCEHVIESAAMFAEKILKKCSNVRIVATSREELKCLGEVIHNLMPLSTPNPEKVVSPEELVQFEAVRLFIERALAVERNFRVTESNASAVANICYKLDGIPLAIELAASRVKSLSVEKIALRLDDRFRLLSGGRRTALPRQQTLKALIDWSHDLLNVNEKILWRRISVFSGGFELEAAERICTTDKIAESEIFDLIVSLVEKSIVIHDVYTEHYRLLESIKYFGQEKLTEAGELEIVSDKHLEYFKSVLSTSEISQSKNVERKTLDNLERDHVNILQAYQWAQKNNLILDELEIVSVMSPFWHIRGYFSEAKNLLERVVARTGEVRNNQRGNVLRRLGYIFSLQGQHDEAMKILEKSLEVYEEIGDEKNIAACLNNLGLAAQTKGHHEMAGEYYSRSLEVREKISDMHGICASLNGLGMLAYEKGDYESAKKRFERLLEISKEIKDREGIGIGLNNLGNIYMHLCEYANAQNALEESLALMKEFGNKWGVSIALLNLGAVALSNNDIDKAKEFYEESLIIKHEVGDAKGIVYAKNGLAKIALRKLDYVLAEELYKESLFRIRNNYDPTAFAGCILGIAEIYSNLQRRSDAALILKKLESIIESDNISLETDARTQYENLKAILNSELSREELNEAEEKSDNISDEELFDMILVAKH